jgi:hypothetical protein
MKTLFTFFLIFALCVNAAITTKAQVNVNDSLALVDLYNSTNGPGWYNHSGWLTGPVKDWGGIYLTEDGNRVMSIYLAGNNLSGYIPSSLGNLSNLLALFLYGNQLSGSIPPELGNLSNVTDMWLGGNQLSGPIPPELGNLSNLNSFQLGGNQLSGPIPPELGNLSNLYLLRLSYNPLTGPIPPELGKLSNLGELDLENDQLSGRIPAELAKLLNLEILKLAYNQLSGSIPPELGNLSRLIQVILSYNQLNGPIPPELGKLSNLQELNLKNNQLSGPIPSSIGNLVNLQWLHLGHNQLSGEIPHSIHQLKYLYYVNISYNQLIQNTNIVFSSSPDIRGNLNNNLFTFNGIEYIAQNLPKVVYAPQAIIPVHQNGNTLSVYAGGTLSKNTYKWYKNGSLIATKTADSTFTPTQSGKYYVNVTNAIATKLTLYSNTVDFITNNLTVNNSLSTDANSSKLKQGLQIYPNPANKIVQVQVNGTATIILTNSAGKIILTRTITNNAFINVNAFAPGTYYIQNKDNGEVKKVVITH